MNWNEVLPGSWVTVIGRHRVSIDLVRRPEEGKPLTHVTITAVSLDDPNREQMLFYQSYTSHEAALTAIETLQPQLHRLVEELAP
jgi:hypothetical protein